MAPGCQFYAAEERRHLRMNGLLDASRAPPGAIGAGVFAARPATRALCCAPRLRAPVDARAGTAEWSSTPETIKPVEVATGLNPADFNANWQNFAKSLQRPLSPFLQGFSA
jgi:hypothetical protein